MSTGDNTNTVKRYSPFRIFHQVLVNRREELTITICIMLALMMSSSLLIFLFERQAQPDSFASIPAAMWWSVAALTTVGYGDVYPITVAGKVFAAFIAMCGIGMFALPTGILGGGFVEEIQNTKDEKRNRKNAQLIKEAFEIESLIRVRKFKRIHKIDCPKKILEFITLQNELNLSTEEVFQAIKNSDGLRIRNIRMSEDSNFEDLVVVEMFPSERVYGGYKARSRELTVINANAGGEAALGHFTEAFAGHLNANYLSNEYFDTGALLKAKRHNFALNDGWEDTQKEVCEEFTAFREDIVETVEKDSVVLVIYSAASSRADVSLAAGGASGESCFDHENPIFEDLGRIKAFHGGLNERLQQEFNQTVSDTIAITDTSPRRLCQFVRRATGANVLSVRINIKTLRWTDVEVYYKFMHELANCVQEHLVGDRTSDGVNPPQA